MPTTWPGLYEQVDRLDLSKRRLSAERAEFEVWAQLIEQRALAEAHGAATLRARELRERTALGVGVALVPAGRSAPRHEARWAGLELSLGASRVDLYSLRSPGSAPYLHLGVQRGATSTRFPVFATLPGALLVRRGQDGFDALNLSPPSEPEAPVPTTVDALVFRAFELLIGAHRSTLA